MGEYELQSCHTSIFKYLVFDKKLSGCEKKNKTEKYGRTQTKQSIETVHEEAQH